LEAIQESLTTRLVADGEVLDAVFVGQSGGLEEEYLRNKGHRFIGISCGKLRRYFSIANFFDIFRVVLGIYQALWIVIQEKPDVIMCKGGFVSLPVAVAAGVWRVPVVLHESDAHMGLANRIAGHFATRVCVAFSNIDHLPRFVQKRVVVTGNPVRPSALDASAADGLEWLGFSGERPVLSIIGGSSGAAPLNTAIGAQLSELLSFCDVFLQCGKGKELSEDVIAAGEAFQADESSRAGGSTEAIASADSVGVFRQEAFVDDIASVMMASDLCIIRGGANSLLDVTIYGVAAVAVPLPGSAGNHQYINVKSLEEQGACVLYEQSRIDADSGVDLVHVIRKMLQNPDELAGLRENALKLRRVDGSEKICEVILGVR